VTMQWVSVNGATVYAVDRSTDNANWSTLTSTAMTSVLDLTAVAGTRYYYRVRAGNGAGSSGNSAVVMAETMEAGTDTGSPTGLDVPAGLVVTGVTSSRVNLSWAEAAGAMGYLVERSADGEHWMGLGAVTGTEFIDAGLAANTRYWYRVRAVNGSGESFASETVAGVTAQAVPVAPGGLSVFGVSAVAVQLNWSDNSGNESGFRVEYSIDGKAWRLAGSVPADTKGVRVTGLAGGKKYYFRVSAYNELGYSRTSNVVTGKSLVLGGARGVASGALAPTVLDIRRVKNTLTGLTRSLAPAAATGLVARAYSNSAVQLVWEDNSDSELGFKVEYSLDGKHWLLGGYVGADQTGCRVTGLRAGRSYWFRVTAYNLAGVSAVSGVARLAMPMTTVASGRPSNHPDQVGMLDVMHVKTAMPGVLGNLQVA
jgi:predicted phage tail protein